MRGNDLSSILPIQLVPIVLFRVVRSSDHGASHTLMLDGRERNDGSADLLLGEVAWDAKVLEGCSCDVSKAM